MTDKNKSIGIRLRKIAETEIPAQKRYTHEAMAFFEFISPLIFELKESRFILRKARHQSYQLECIYKATEKDGIFGEKTATTKLMGTPKLKVLVDAIVEWGGTQKHPPGTRLSIRFEVARELKQYSYIFLQILHHRKNLFVETASLGRELRSLFDTIIETEIVYFYEQGKEKKCRILDKGLLKKLKKEILIYKEGRGVQATIKAIPGLIKYSQGFLGSKLVTKEQIERQLPLFEEKQGAVKAAIRGGVEGIDLTVYEERALNAVLVKHDKFDYQVDALDFTKSELFDLAGIDKVKTSRGKLKYPGRETKKIEEALKKLDKTRYPIILSQYSHYDREEEKKKYNVAAQYQSLINVIWFYKDVGEDELIEYEAEQTFDKADKKLSPHFSHWRIGLNPLVKSDIDKFRMLPANVYKLIKEYKKSKADDGKRTHITQSETLFIQFLHRHGKGKRVIRIDPTKLAKQLKLTTLIDSRKWGLLRSTLNDLYELAKGLGFLTGYEIEVPKVHGKGQTVDVLYLNPDKIYHLKKAKKT